MKKSELLLEIKKLVENYFLQNNKEFVPGKTTVPLGVPSYGYEEVNEAIDSLLSSWVTMGEKVKKFEESFAKYIGVKHAIMVNSGSSANLLSLAILTNPSLSSRLKPGEEVITPALTWATTVYPIVNNGLKPVFVDVTLETFDIDVDKIENAITDKTKAILPVHLLGNPANMERINEIAQKHGLYVIEDACEAHGAEYNGKKAGSFGDFSTFSFYLSHHITTIEGGMLLTNNDEFFELGKALRAFGWIKNLKDKSEISKQHPNIDPRFLFVNIGFNIRPTELQGAFGIHQITKLEKFIKIRKDNAIFLENQLSKFSEYIQLPKEISGTRHSFFGYAILVKDSAPFSCKQLADHLESNMIEIRPIMAGNLVEQPSSKLYDHRISGDLKNSSKIMRDGLFLPIHQDIGKEQRKYMADCIIDFIENEKWKIKN